MNEYEKATTLVAWADAEAGAVNAWLRQHGPRTEIRGYCPRHHGDVVIATVWPPHTTFRWREDRELSFDTWRKWAWQHKGGPRWCKVCACSVFMTSRGCREVRG